MAELFCPTGSPDPQQSLETVLFADRAGFPPAPSGECSVVTASPAESVPMPSLPAQETAPAAASPAMTPVPSPRCAMRLPVHRRAPFEVIHTPFLDVQDPAFVDGYQAGTTAFFEQVWDEQQDRQGRLLTDQDLIAELEQTLREAQWKAAEQAPAAERTQWLAWTAGYLTGLISARIPSSLPLYGNCGRCHQPVRACGHCPRCDDPCTCLRSLTSDPAAAH